MAVIAGAMLGVLVVAFFRAAPVEMAYPAERANASWSRKVAARWHGLWHGVAASAENVQLRRDLAALKLDREEVMAIRAENDRLRKALDYNQREGGAWIAAEVLSYGGGAAGAAKTIRVGRGSGSGVRVGAVVAVPEGLVGRVISVTPHTANILLVTDPSLKVACVVEGEKPWRAILSGGTDDRLVLRHLKAGALVAPRSRVLTSGLGGIFPAGIQVGTFITDESGRDAGRREAGGLEREGWVQPAVDFSLLEDVFIRR